MKMYALTKSSRWCPTPEQVMILEEMYRGGIRTPKAAQIQAITAHLSHYGKIENKNVFYWFQNHKARDRQKHRKKLIMSKQIHLHHQHLKYQNEPSPQLFYYFPIAVLPQGGVINASPQSTSSQKLDPQTADHQSLEVDKAVVKTINQDWLVVLDEVPAKNKPLETLELFPTTPTGLNNGCNITSTPSLSFSHSTH